MQLLLEDPLHKVPSYISSLVSENCKSFLCEIFSTYSVAVPFTSREICSSQRRISKKSRALLMKPWWLSEHLMGPRSRFRTLTKGWSIQKKRYQIFLKSSTGPVEVFLVSLQDKIDEELGKSEPRLSPPLGASIPESFALSPAITMDAEDGRKMRSQKTLAAENPDNQPRTMAPKSNSESQPGHLETTVAEGHSTVPISESLGNSQAFLRIMPPSCDPDYWFSDEGKELGLSDMFYPSGVNGAHPLC